MTSRTQLVASLEGLVPGASELDTDELRERHAYAAWSCLTEPGDAVAGAAIQALGAAGALDAARSGSAAPADETWVAGVRRWAPRWSGISDAFDRARTCGARLLTPADPEWPRHLDDLGVHAPRCLWVQGSPAALATGAAVALVGARAATGYGEHVAGELAAGVGGAGITVVSGGAYGIDGMAHRAALAGGGVTVAFVAGGVDRPYPAGHASLLARISEAGGAVAAEVPCGTSPTKWRFLQRNRLIAALSDATVVVEAGWRSGSLNTAGHAAALGRPLGAVPGPVTSAASAGCHRLLREYDARCVTTPDEVLELLGHEGADAEHPSDRTDDRTRLLDALSARSGRMTSDVARRAGFSEDEAQTLLGFAELDGLARRQGDRWLRGAETDRHA
ncbi:DNA-processing protein DprA [Microbacterium sp.]|uniref:DNA-processing protein DprA n=1 Tax=Microbacterium sp. TaxID=51671 RepID=UPI0037355F0C